MRNIIFGLTAAAGLLAVAPVAASAAPVVPIAPGISHSAIQRADWDYCGPRCQYWRHRRWEHARREHWRWERRHEYGWRHEPYAYQYGYSNGWR